MSESGEMWREYREHKRRFRKHMHECPHCAVRFGTGTKVVPGERCRNCDWVAPAKSAMTGKP